MIKGYTYGTFDLLHVGHLNFLAGAKGMCDKLVVGIKTDELARRDGKEPILSLEDRVQIMRSVCYADTVIIQYESTAVEVCRRIGAEILFVGDDWYGSDKWNGFEKEAKKYGIKIVYIPYTRGMSSTRLKRLIVEACRGKREEKA